MDDSGRGAGRTPVCRWRCECPLRLREPRAPSPVCGCPVGGLDEAARWRSGGRPTISCVDDQRSDPRERRRWLRVLDPVLTDEIRDAGALSCEELIQMAAHPLKGRASRATIEEWWEYAHRRCWLEQHRAGRYRLTSIGREELQVRREDVDGPDLAEWAKTIMRWTLAGGAIGAAVYLSGRYGTVWLALLVVCIVVALMLFIAAPIARSIDRPADRWAARHACDWLDGRPIRCWVRRHPAVRGEVRRLYPPDELRTVAASSPPASTG